MAHPLRLSYSTSLAKDLETDIKEFQTYIEGKYKENHIPEKKMEKLNKGKVLVSLNLEFLVTKLETIIFGTKAM